jgi:hypothetical protein
MLIRSWETMGATLGAELNWLNDRVIEIRFVAAPEDEAPEAIWTIRQGPTEVGMGEVLVQELVDSLYENADVEPPPPYVVDVERTHYEWGAEGATETIILWLADVALSGLTFEALKLAFKRVIEKATTSGLPGHPVTRREAEERARWAISSDYGVPDIELRITETTEVPGMSWDFRFEAAGATYEASIGIDEGFPVVTRLLARSTG